MREANFFALQNLPKFATSRISNPNKNQMNKRVFSALTASLIIAFSGLNITALAEQYPLQITAQANSNDVAEIRISGVIHQWQNSSAEFKLKIDELIAKGIKDVKLYINTPGGSVFEANEIANEIKRFSGKISGYGGALVASAGSYLALICDSFELADNGQYMYHKPMGFIQGNEDKVAADLKLLQNLTNQYRTAYSQKTGLDEATIEANWSKGDVWLSAKEAKEQGFITGISGEAAKVTEDQKAMFVACGAPTIPTLTVIPKAESNMKNRNEIIAKLKLAADATDEQIFAALSTTVDQNATAQQTIEAQAAAAKTNAETLVDKAILDKKITADVREDYVFLATTNFEKTKSILDKMPAISKASEHLQTPPEATAGREKWTLEDYQAKDPKALEALMVSDPDAFAKLEAEYFAK